MQVASSTGSWIAFLAVAEVGAFPVGLSSLTHDYHHIWLIILCLAGNLFFFMLAWVSACIALHLTFLPVLRCYLRGPPVSRFCLTVKAQIEQNRGYKRRIRSHRDQIRRNEANQFRLTFRPGNFIWSFQIGIWLIWELPEFWYRGST